MRSSAQPQGSSQAQSTAPFGQGSHVPYVIPASATPTAPSPQVRVPQAEGHDTSVAAPSTVQALAPLVPVLPAVHDPKPVAQVQPPTV
ncbi:hypothetical protein U1Q18_002455 [Sarracenia purpurea var. burkii]